MWIGGQNAGLGLFSLKINTSELVSIGERFICVKGESMLCQTNLEMSYS